MGSRQKTSKYLNGIPGAFMISHKIVRIFKNPENLE